MQQSFETIIQALGEDLEREGLRDTPARAARALQYLTKGYQESLDDIINDALFESDMN
ncbi:MAG TPA: GTP cyclohydrolase I, partial [Legionellaceae bacterium]|nr:GTP cyclohydrolase I [Legionellaceae bacterium]